MLIPELELQALRFFNRDELEGLQMHSRYLRNLVDSHAKTLPLRRIHELCVGAKQLFNRERDLGFLRYLRPHTGALQCRIQTLCIDWSVHEFDNTLFDFLDTQLKPQRYSAAQR
ncbi:hypothetical protein AAVH_18186 [Aphelenchoides avenae]|nr:hypothetical protein AAVH_18186 [Aphelenchus avenae]